MFGAIFLVFDGLVDLRGYGLSQFYFYPFFPEATEIPEETSDKLRKYRVSLIECVNNLCVATARKKN